MDRLHPALRARLDRVAAWRLAGLHRHSDCRSDQSWAVAHGRGMRRRVTPRAAAHADMAHARGNLSGGARLSDRRQPRRADRRLVWARRSEEHTSELQSLMPISYAVLCSKTKTTTSNSCM